MGAIVAIVAIVAVFGLPAYVIKRALDLREKRMELEGGSRNELESGAMKELAAMREENKLLQARVEAMEDTMMSGDYELNQKLKAIAIAESAAPKLPGTSKS
jgi:hypothetical protein